MSSYPYGGIVRYDVRDGTFDSGFVNPGPGELLEDPTPDTIPGLAFSVDGVFEQGEEVDDRIEPLELVYQGTAEIDGHTMLGLAEDSFPPTYFYFFTPDGVNPASVTWPATTSSITVVNNNTTICFAAGTGIATKSGEVAVQTLQTGDLLRTAGGNLVKVKWLARQTLKRWIHGTRMQPVRIRAGALGGGLPHTDLIVTADHGMVLDEYVVIASVLVNGGTIDFVPIDELADSFTVYHVETERHDVILANGAPAETYIDYRDRRSFDNYQEYLDLYGAERIIPEMPLPRISAARLLPAHLRDRLGISELRLTG